MTTKQILNLDCRKQENRIIIQKALRMIKPLSKYSMDKDIPISLLEKVIKVISCKYDIELHDISPNVTANDSAIIWRAWLIHNSDLSTICYVHGISLYETIAKVCIKMHSLTKSNKTMRGTKYKD